MHDGKWRYPKDRTAIRQFIKTSGAVNYELVCTTTGCRFHSSPIPNKAAEHLVKKLPLLHTRYSNHGRSDDPRCCYDGCESTQIEWHHFAPFNTFGVEADNFPVRPLCRYHHRYWHLKMDGYQWRARASQ